MMLLMVTFPPLSPMHSTQGRIVSATPKRSEVAFELEIALCSKGEDVRNHSRHQDRKELKLTRSKSSDFLQTDS